jgi:hypothetical protein
VLHPSIDDHVVLPASNEESNLLRTLTNGESGWLNRIWLWSQEATQPSLDEWIGQCLEEIGQPARDALAMSA